MEEFVHALEKIPGEKCRNHTYELFKHIFQEKELWAFQLVDAIGKIPAGLLTANFVHYGNMDECLSVKASTEHGNFTGKYCLVESPLPVPHSEEYPSLKHLIKYHHGFCMPSSCNSTDLTVFLQNVLSLPVDDVYENNCITPNYSRPYQPKEILAICIITFFLLLMLLSSIYDCWNSSATKNKIFLAFSLPRNFKTMIDMNSPPGSIDSLHGMRFFAIACVVLSHVYMIAPFAANAVNMSKFLTWLSDWNHIWFTSRGILLDGLFVMGGLLTTYIFMRDREKGEKFNFFIYCLHRVMRLGPAMYMVLLFTSTLVNRMSSVPQWRLVSEAVENGCAEHWWENVLFINSWFGSMKTCMGHTWYISVDMTLYVLSPLLLIPLHRKPKFGLWLISGTTVVAFLGSFISSYVLEEHADLFEHKDGWEEFLYVIPYNRAVPWLLGLLFGYVLHKNRHRKRNAAHDAIHDNDGTGTNIALKKCKKWLLSAIIMLSSLGCGVGIMLCVHPFLQRGYPFSAFEHSIYIATSHIVASLFFIIALGGILAGYGGLAEVIFSCKIFIPLGRLSYSVYLIHILLVELWYVGSMGNYNLSDSTHMLTFIAILMYSVLFSPILFLMVEQPFVILDKLLLHSGNSQDNAERKPIVPQASRSGSIGYVNNGMELTHRPIKGMV